MDIANIISTIVVMVFAYIVAKHKLIPYLVSRKAKKQALGKQETAENTSPGLPAFPDAVSASFLSSLAALSSGQATQSGQTGQGNSDSPYYGRLATYIDFRFLPICREDDDERIEQSVNEMLLAFSKRGIAPDLGFCPISEHCLMVYATYKM